MQEDFTQTCMAVGKCVMNVDVQNKINDYSISCFFLPICNMYLGLPNDFTKHSSSVHLHINRQTVRENRILSSEHLHVRFETLRAILDKFACIV